MKLIRVVPIIVSAWIGVRSAAAYPAPAPSAKAVALPNADAATLDRVRAAIGSDNALRYEAGRVQISTRDGVVTLRGTVSRQAIRQRMEQVARSVAGVPRVVNLLTIDPNSSR
jgi:osmotically-inducible protein OsmY